MRSKGAFLFWTDVINAILFAGLIGTGSVLKWALPPGSGGGGGGGDGGMHRLGRGFRGGRAAALTLWDWTRHEWGDVHFYVALALAGGVGLHLLLHLGYLRASSLRYLLPFRAHRRVLQVSQG